MFTNSTSAFRTVLGAFGTVICAGACLIGATAPAAAAPMPVDASQTAVVSYADLNLASDHGRNALDARIRFAARNVCETGARDVASMAQASRCVRAAVEAAQPTKVTAIADYKG
ncbi:MAG: UrcA family protein [Sandarakinorhabdus sp.]|nr:UrcA family protein [Sandarakinorhabdus sp.]